MTAFGRTGLLLSQVPYRAYEEVMLSTWILGERMVALEDITEEGDAGIDVLLAQGEAKAEVNAAALGLL